MRCGATKMQAGEVEDLGVALQSTPHEDLLGLYSSIDVLT